MPARFVVRVLKGNRMRLDDLLYMSSGSLWKRKVRTILTVLGVVIGTASIVVMVSLGLGLNRSTMQDIEENGGLTSIEVREADSYSYDGGETAEKDKKRLDDDLVKLIRGNPHVKLVSPVLTVNVLAKCGAYENNYMEIRGMSSEALQNMDFPLADGEIPVREDELVFLYGNQVIAEFMNSRTNSGYWMDGTIPDIDFKNDSVFIIYDMDSYYNSMDNLGNGQQGSGKPPKKYLAGYAGLIDGGMDTYKSYSWRVYCNIVPLEAHLKRLFRGKVIPGQPSTASGKPYKQFYYNELYVEVDDMANVSEVQKWITDMGYQTYSNTEWVDSMKKQYSYIQAVLGGIGAVSLIVAAIGITNTMMMSIYERTKEIGVMKVIGCDMRDIRTLFLMEAGFIGLIGGVVGIGFSFLISFIINQIVMKMGMEMTLSYIPLWLAGSSVGFAILVGMVAGFFLVLRAMRLSPLAAIRNE